MVGNWFSTLEARVGAVLTGSLLALLLVAAQLWVLERRAAIHEEVSAATRVAEQFLKPRLAALAAAPDPASEASLIAELNELGRLRANALEVRHADGRLLHHSPEPLWKAGREAPAWFAAWVAPRVEGWSHEYGGLRIALVPDTSRATLDAWDDLRAALGWAAALLLLVWLGSRVALRRALAPLQRVDDALMEAADGQFQTRLPEFGVREIDRVAMAYNRLADSLMDTRAANRRLGDDRDFARALQHRLEIERRILARELHDELGQGIAAVRAIAGSILQRARHDPQLHGSAQAMLAMTGQMQDGARAILGRLRSFPSDAGSLHQTLHSHCMQWQQIHPGILLEVQLDATPETVAASVSEQQALALLRVLQESLTNVARHARASQVLVRLALIDQALTLSITDDGHGMPLADSPPGHFGINGMRERMAELGGRLSLERPEGGGLRVAAWLPVRADVGACV